MRFSIRQSMLLDIIQTVSKAVAVRTPKQILNGILLNIDANKLTATAYDLELGIERSITPDEDNQLTIYEEGRIVLPARYFSDIIRKLPGQNVNIAVKSNYMTEIRSGSAEFHLHGIDAAEFPKLPTFQKSRSLPIPANTLATLIKSTVFAASNLEVRPILTGVQLVHEGNSITFTATDALRMARKQAEIEESSETERWSSVIPAKSLNELLKLLTDDDSPVTFQCTESHSLFEVGSTLFYTRLIEGTYPETNRIIPAAHKTEVGFDVEGLRGALDRAQLIARDREVRLDIAETGVTITSNSPDVGNLTEQVEVVSREGDALTIAFNAKYVIEALRALEQGTVRIRFNGWNQPFVIRQDGDDFGLQLISPVLMR
jgi:DNA polymerase III subunit beta